MAAPAKKAAPRATKAAGTTEAQPVATATPPLKQAAPLKAFPAQKAAPARKAAPKKAPSAQAAPENGAPEKSVSAKPAPEKSAPAKKAAQKAAPVASSPAGGWSTKELAEVRAELTAELSRMDTGHDESIAALEELTQHNSVGAGDDQADAGAATFEREQELSIVANRVDLMGQMRRAIARIDAGAYGSCESCGKAIPKARLQAFPAATLDVECKQREERR